MKYRIPISLITSVTLVVSATAFGATPLPSGEPTNLTLEQMSAVVEAAKIEGDLEWRVLTTEVNGQPKTIVFLGEHHFALPADLAGAKKVVDQFEQFAVENGASHSEARYTYRTMPMAMVLMLPVQLLMQALEGRLPTSSMNLPLDGARVRAVHNAEILHKPSWSEEFDLMTITTLDAGGVFSIAFMLRSLARMVSSRSVRPYGMGFLRAAGVFAGLRLGGYLWQSNASTRPLIKNRDADMAKFIDQWVREPQNDQAMLVIVGQLHLDGMEKYLTQAYHFKAGHLECGASGCGVLANN